MTRKNILLSALLVTLWLTWRAYEQEQVVELAAPTRELPVNASPNTLSQSIGQLILSERKAEPSQTNLFSTPGVPLNAPVKMTAPKPPPTAPILPFKYLGRMQAGSGNGVMLDVQGEVTPIQQGDILQGQYKVQSITETAAGLQIQFLYLPLNQIQTLNAQTAN